MIIQIEGHVNAPTGRYSGEERFPGELQDLSDDRAETVRQYLTDKGIAEERIRTIGLAGSQMLFPNPKDEIEASANRRVEIKVISMQGE